MNWRDATDFFAMGGYGLYVWGAYGLAALVIVLEAVLARGRHRAALAALNRQAAGDAEREAAQ